MIRTATSVVLLLTTLNQHAIADARGTYLAVDVGHTTSDAEAVIAGGPAEATSSTIPGADFDSAINWGVTFGHQLKNGIGLEIEYTATRFETDSSAQTIDARPEVLPFLEGATQEGFLYTGEAEISNVAINLSYHYLNSSKITPFARIGYGYAEVDGTINYSEQPRFDIFALPTLNFETIKTDGSSWNVGFGAAYAITDIFHIELEYVVSDFDTDFSTATEPETGSRVDFSDFSNSRFDLSFKLWL